MAKKEKRSKGSGAGAGAARKQHAAKEAAARRRSQKSARSTPLSWIRKNWLTASLVSFAALAMAFMLVSSRSRGNGDGDGDGDGDRLIPPIVGVAVEASEERGNKTQGFLNSFVCDYQPATDEVAEIDIRIGEKGYCHPRLSAAPNYRTQRVSILHDPAADSSTPTSVFQKLKKLGEETLHYLTTDESESDHGIPKGELLMRLPRSLQVWDLDALRDTYIQQEFLGLHPNEDSEVDVDGIEEDGSEESSSKVAARDAKTGNQLDSGAYLAVHLIRLSSGFRARSKKKPSVDDDNDGQCQDENGECKLLQNWDSFDQHHQQRISTLAAYFDVLPTSTDRMSLGKDSKNINPHSHALFWSSRLVKAMFPPNTYTFDLIRHYQQMVVSEYEALKLASDEFGEKVDYLKYLNARANVLSRAFGVPTSSNDDGALWGVEGDAKELSLVDEMRSYKTSNFGSFLAEEEVVEEFKLRAMCPLLDMYNSHPNPNVSWRYDSKTSSFEVHASKERGISPGHSIVVSYGKYTDGHMFAKYGYVNGDGSSHTEISLAVFHWMLGDLGLGRQYSKLPFQLWNPDSRDEIFDSLIDGEDDLEMDTAEWKILISAKEALEMQYKELARYLMFDDGYDECIDASANLHSSEEELKLLKLKHLIRLANYRDAWMVRMPPQFPDARPLQTLSFDGKDELAESNSKEPKGAVGIKAEKIVSICRLLSMRTDDIGGDAIEYLREGLTSSGSSKSSSGSYFLVGKHEDTLEYRAMMCIVRLCNVGLSRYVGYDNVEPEEVGSKAWNAWYITSGEVRVLGMLQQTASKEAGKFKRKHLSSNRSAAATDEAMIVREEGACSINYTLPLLRRL